MAVWVPPDPAAVSPQKPRVPRLVLPPKRQAMLPKRHPLPCSRGYGPTSSAKPTQRPKPTSVTMLTPKKEENPKDWTSSSEWSEWCSDWSSESAWTWSSWNSKEEWVQHERFKWKDTDTDAKQKAQSWDKELAQAYSDMELDLVSGKEALSEYKEDLIGLCETGCQEFDNDEDDEYESIRVEEPESEENNDREALIRRTREVLKRHRGEAPLLPPSKKVRMGPSGKAGWKRAKGRGAKLQDDKSILSMVEVQDLRYSQKSCKEEFQCGRSVMQLVDDLLHKRVPLSAPFLRLTVFETTDHKTGEPILRCIDNRRLFALKKYAKKIGKDRMMVNVNFFCQDTISQVLRFLRNSDNTDGYDVRFRQKRASKPREPLKGRLKRNRNRIRKRT